MQLLSHVLRKAVVSKKLSQTSHVGIALHAISEHIDHKITVGHIKNGILFLSLPNHGKKMLLYREKWAILQEIHKKLGEYGYAIKIKDIRFSS